jgi:hypothetical protein
LPPLVSTVLFRLVVTGFSSDDVEGDQTIRRDRRLLG